MKIQGGNSCYHKIYPWLYVGSGEVCVCCGEFGEKYVFSGEGSGRDESFGVSRKLLKAYRQN